LEPCALTLENGTLVHVDFTRCGLSDDVLARVAKKGLSAVCGGTAGLRIVDYVIRCVADNLAMGGGYRFSLSAGRILAREIGLGETSGKRAREVQAALLAWSSITLADPAGALGVLWYLPKHTAPAPGRPGSWMLPAGALLRYNRSYTDPKWRRLVPWPDVLPPDKYVRANLRAAALRLGPALAVEWRRAASRDHGARWLHAPGVALTDELWREVAPELDRDAALEALEAARWAVVDGARLVPGEALPRLRRELDEQAARAIGGRLREVLR